MLETLPADALAFRAEVRTFLAEYPKRSWKEWNWADARAYQALTAVPK